MRRPLALLLIAAVALLPGACRKQPEGEVRAVVIGAAPKLKDPAAQPLSAGDEVLMVSTAQGLVGFDAAGNIVGGLAERWNVSDDGLSYIFRLASAQWPDGSKITAQQVARILKRQLGARSRNPLKDALGAVEDVVAMTDRVIEIRLIAPRPNLLPILAQPQFAVQRNGFGTGPFRASTARDGTGELQLTREILSGDEDVARKDEVLLGAAPAAQAVQQFAGGRADLVLGGRFNDLPYARAVKLPRNALRFDPASGLFGLVPVQKDSAFDEDDRRMLSQAIDRDGFVAAFGIAGLVPRATLLEPGLEGLATPVAPAWAATPLAARLPALRAQADGSEDRRKVVRVAVPAGPGADLLLRFLQRDWGALGFLVERAQNASAADFALIDEVAPSSSPAWFARHFRCGATPVCDEQVDELLDAARTTLVPAQRSALLAQAAARIDDLQLFIPITAPIRWSLVSRRIQAFAGNRYARHTLVDLERSEDAN